MISLFRSRQRPPTLLVAYDYKLSQNNLIPTGGMATRLKLLI